jgi:hypothetical protein
MPLSTECRSVAKIALTSSPKSASFTTLSSKKRQPGKQFAFGLNVARKVGPNQKDTIDIVGFKHICHKAAIYYQPIDASPMSQLNQPTQGFHLYTPDFRLAPKAALDFFKLGWMNARRQIPVLVEWRDHRFLSVSLSESLDISRP